MSAIENIYSKFCDGRFPLPSEQEVFDLEQKLGIPLPPEYRRFILEYNGGYFSDPLIVLSDPDYRQDCLTTLWGIHAPLPFAELGHDVDLFDDNDPPEILPIGYTIMGNLLYIVTHIEEYGSIGMKLAYSSKTFFMASSIEGFFELISLDRER